MEYEGKLWVAKSDEKVFLLPRMANRHGLIAGASGTGKSVTLKVLAESFSEIGVPVFLSDIKGDMAGLLNPGAGGEKMERRIDSLGIDRFSYEGFPCRFWDVYGENGHPVRVTVESMGADALSRILELSQVQTDVLRVVFRICADSGWRLVDSKDLVSVLQYLFDNRADYESEYGSMSSQSLGAIQRSVRALADRGGDTFFGEPALDIHDWMGTADDGRGWVNILHSVKLAHNPKLYATFLVWLMTELFRVLPEEGDPEKPKLVFFFDEAHMLFSDAPKNLLQDVERTVKLIRSKGVGIYFISQSPSDIPDSVLSQLSNRVQHALRAYTPGEQKAVRVAASAFRPNPAFKTEDVITELGVGEALVSFLDAEGRPGVVQKAKILPPKSFMGSIPAADYEAAIKGTKMDRKYGRTVDGPSAYEAIEALRKKAPKEEKAAKKAEPKKKESALSKNLSKMAGSASSAIGRGIGGKISKKLFGRK
ncbi:MAG: DUF853 family protein [Thermoplasmatales archaeon]|nr:DUF853 family protein [Thermoplasmatales archaeon]